MKAFVRGPSRSLGPQHSDNDGSSQEHLAKRQDEQKTERGEGTHWASFVTIRVREGSWQKHLPDRHSGQEPRAEARSKTRQASTSNLAPDQRPPEHQKDLSGFDIENHHCLTEASHLNLLEKKTNETVDERKQSPNFHRKLGKQGKTSVSKAYDIVTSSSVMNLTCCWCPNREQRTLPQTIPFSTHRGKHQHNE